MAKNQFKKGEIIIYKSKAGPNLDVRLEEETVWLTQAQIAKLFGTQRPAITKHLNNIFKSKELVRNSVCSKMEHTAADGKTYDTAFYNLDAIISVGYRVNSRRATQFRIWATKTLKDYLVKGYAINEKMLAQAKEKFDRLRDTVSFLQEKSKADRLRGQEGEILDLLAAYAKTTDILDEYDRGAIGQVKDGKPKFILSETIAFEAIARIKKDLTLSGRAGNLFGIERDDSFKSTVGNLYQTFGGKELYPSLGIKAAHLLYLTIKDHPFSDGNKRLASILFVYFMDKNGALYRTSGEKKINDNALAALALLIAESKPQEKDQMIALITQLIR
jgi:prophage maintenance system killer protein